MRERGERNFSTQQLFGSEGNTLTRETPSPDRFEALRRLNNAIPKDSAAFFFAGRQLTHCRQKTHCSAVQAWCLRPTPLAARLNSWSERGGLRPCCSPRRQPLLERTRRPTPPLLPYWSERSRPPHNMHAPSLASRFIIRHFEMSSQRDHSDMRPSEVLRELHKPHCTTKEAGLPLAACEAGLPRSESNITSMISAGANLHFLWGFFNPPSCLFLCSLCFICIVPPHLESAQPALVAEQMFFFRHDACQTAELRVDLHSTWRAQIFGATSMTGHLVVPVYVSVE